MLYAISATRCSVGFFLEVFFLFHQINVPVIGNEVASKLQTREI